MLVASNKGIAVSGGLLILDLLPSIAMEVDEKKDRKGRGTRKDKKGERK